jgi:hypothetical protein
METRQDRENSSRRFYFPTTSDENQLKQAVVVMSFLEQKHSMKDSVYLKAMD